MNISPDELSVVSPARYRISVLGEVDENITHCLGGLSIESQESYPECGKSVTTLNGRLADQAALFGALNALYNMRLPLLSVEYLRSDKKKGE